MTSLMSSKVNMMVGEQAQRNKDTPNKSLDVRAKQRLCYLTLRGFFQLVWWRFRPTSIRSFDAFLFLSEELQTQVFLKHRFSKWNYFLRQKIRTNS